MARYTVYSSWYYYIAMSVILRFCSQHTALVHGSWKHAEHQLCEWSGWDSTVCSYPHSYIFNYFYLVLF